MKGFINFLHDHQDIQSVVSGLSSGLKEQLITGLSGSARSMWISTIQAASKRRLLIITNHLSQAQQLYDDLNELINPEAVHLYPVNELLVAEMAVSSPELRSQRIGSLTAWAQQREGVLIAPVAALKRILPPISYWETFKLYFKLGEDINIDQYLAKLVKMGYERVDMVASPGEFSMRGGIIDLYPITEDHPVRIELFDEEVDSIRFFDANSQRSLEKVDKVTILPVTELLLTGEDMSRAADRLENSLAAALKKNKNANEKAALHEQIHHDLDRLRRREGFEDMYKYNQYYYDQPSSLLDYLGNDGYIFIDEIGRVQESAQILDKEEAEWIATLLADYKMVPDLSLSFDWSNIWAMMVQSKIYLSVFLRHVTHTMPQNVVNITSRAMQQFHGQMSVLQSEMKRWQKADYSIVFLASTPQRAEKIQSILADYQIETGLADETVRLPVKQPIVMVGNLSTGFELPMQKLALLTDQELFKARVTRRKQKKQKLSNAERIKSYQELKVGDYVVHVNHGIGRFVGVETLKVQDVHKDFMLIKYNGDDKLFVPIDQIDLVQKYVGSEGKEPKLYKLGGAEWKKVKRKVQSRVEDIADDLIKLYAEREASVGHAFGEDTLHQREFEDAFPYQETEDQLRCIEEIKQDMQRTRPMDRLLCGDVGYGKTEVAIRAAFKAIMEGKQVAILVPTTILAQQHYETVIERFQEYPIEIGLLSRFRTKKQQTETLKGLKEGVVDLVIGTHRLLSKDVQYKDLGLLIVDEEQRFGVKHKEKIKQLKATVDVLTLTATPIPRTLHMSMLGVRDLSVIETPPANRFPIQTYVLEYNPMLLRESIERELARGGQVFFLYNRVESIERKAQEIQMLVPEARVAVAHGQMNETELENVMLAFLAGEYDVLVSTTIIETGVDIPNVNTLIVDKADRMGLSQLYQLRGRVGRSNRIAYAYFTYQKDKVLTEVAEKRLQAIKEFTELGSGFKIAMRDLSIRGAGNILGAQQHGFIDSVGFDLYSEMLKEAIERRKEGYNGEEKELVNPELNLTIDAYIPDSYIRDGKQKINMYKRFRAANDHDTLEDIKEELVDRFGDYPIEVDNLVKVTALRIGAKTHRIETIRESNKKIVMTFDNKGSKAIDGAKLFRYSSDFGRMILLSTDQEKLMVTFSFSKQLPPDRYQYIDSFIGALEKLKH
ncbi:transcription-repair coupling factor (superfamily II helicase) [Amphibacillus marinus]|uniref:Transcription-repair-coupling factor n=1 Tax=Amphibacillus marinus TaxID=872970 RepID=A0A1H8TQ87_9BACI|nr:transcription-repair coupling factor [Amphibacillus marinus]SEO92986.1 transcription-repair coupling factor (superfamily II helicase) [Amphibacillus marinus]